LNTVEYRARSQP